MTKLNLLIFIYFERERGDTEREGKRTPSSLHTQHWADLMTLRLWLEPNPESDIFNQMNHPGAPHQGALGNSKSQGWPR